jgi:asparagine synthase (glutamine-hydrolysing)
MCGIWASINAPDAVAGLQAAAHRGPDGEGWARFDTPAGRLELGHRRLAIYDPTPASDQPAAYADGRYTVVFNGALYNYRELREALKALGYIFQTTGDTEVFLAAFAEWGRDCFAKIDGMFAAVFYDAKRQVLTIARDRFGEKPLHGLTFGNGGIAFASEVSQLFSATESTSAIQKETLSLFLTSGGMGADSFFRNIQVFPAAHSVELDLSAPVNDLPPARSFWSAPATEEMSEDAAISALREAMELAVSRQLVADVPVGGCLSGGLDSTIILATAERLRDARSQPFVCVSAIFDEADDGGQSLSERPYVEAAIKDRNIELVEVHPGEEDVAERLDDILRRQGEPFPGTSICAQYFVFEAARKAGIKVMLDGQGADELFAGYAPMAGYAMADRLARLDPSFFSEFKALVAEPSDLSHAGLSRGIWRALASEPLRRQVLSAIGRFPPKGGAVAPVIAPPFRLVAGQSRLETLVCDLSLDRSLPSLLRYEDRNSMAFAVETRLPFLSGPVGDLAFRIPSRFKVKNGFTKNILREAFKDRLPPDIAWRRKKLGFVTPQQKWMRGKVGRWVDQHLESSIDTFRPILNADWIETERARKASGQSPGETAFRVSCAGRWAELTGARL